MLLQLHHSPTIAVGNMGSAVPVAQGVAMLKPPETGRSRKEQALDEAESSPPVESLEKSKRASLETPDAAEARLLQALKQRDREVRAHEQAHAAVAGAYALGGPVYEYQRGPNGQMYAIGGHVKLDTAPVPGDPEATLQKAETLRRAAMAPAQPSGQDRRVAVEATSMAMDARAELRIETTSAMAERFNAGADSKTGQDGPPGGKDLNARLRASGALPQPPLDPLDLTA